MKLRMLLSFTVMACFPAAAAVATGGSASFAQDAPLRYEAVSSVVIQYRWFKFPALGAMSVDARKHNFALVGMSQIGINVFELSDKNGVIKSRMPGPLLKRNPQIATGAVDDVRSMFFDLAPGPGACRHDTAAQVIFEEKSTAGTLERRYDKASGLLVEKRFSTSSGLFSGRSVVRVVRYENYATSNGKTYARVVRLKNRHLHYAISTRIMEMRIKP